MSLNNVMAKVSNSSLLACSLCADVRDVPSTYERMHSLDSGQAPLSHNVP